MSLSSPTSVQGTIRFRDRNPGFGLRVRYERNVVSAYRPALSIRGPAVLDRAKGIMLPIVNGKDASMRHAFAQTFCRPSLGPAVLMFWTTPPGRYLLSIPAFHIGLELDILAGFRCVINLESMEGGTTDVRKELDPEVF